MRMMNGVSHPKTMLPVAPQEAQLLGLSVFPCRERPQEKFGQRLRTQGMAARSFGSSNFGRDLSYSSVWSALQFDRHRPPPPSKLIVESV
jgi:hypothetical protein